MSETGFDRWPEQALEAIDEAMRDSAERGKGDFIWERRLAEGERTIGRLAQGNELLGEASRWLS